MIKWEYCSMAMENVHAMNRFGKNGWELVTFADDHRAYFKRPIAEDE